MALTCRGAGRCIGLLGSGYFNKYIRAVLQHYHGTSSPSVAKAYAFENIDDWCETNVLDAIENGDFDASRPLKSYRDRR